MKLGDHAQATIEDPDNSDAVISVHGVITELIDVDGEPAAHVTFIDAVGEPVTFTAFITDITIQPDTPYTDADRLLQIHTQGRAAGHILDTDIDFHASARANETRLRGQCACGEWATPPWDEHSVAEAHHDHLYALTGFDYAPRTPRLCTCIWWQPASGGYAERQTFNPECVLHAHLDRLNPAS